MSFGTMSEYDTFTENENSQKSKVVISYDNSMFHFIENEAIAIHKNKMYPIVLA